MCAHQAAAEVGQRQRQRPRPHNMAVGHKKTQRGQIGGEVDDFGRSGGGEEIISEKAHENKGQQAAGARAEHAVVKADKSTRPAYPWSDYKTSIDWSLLCQKYPEP